MKREASRPVCFLGTDSFVLALNGLMSRRGQGSLLGQTVLELRSCPETEALRSALFALVSRFPLLHATVRRFLFFPPVWVPVVFSKEFAPCELPLFFWHTPDVPLPNLSPSRPISDIETLQKELLSQPLSSAGNHWNFRADLIVVADGTANFLFTWSHLLFDGKGVELLLQALCEPDSISPPSFPSSLKKRFSFQEKFFLIKRIANHFSSLASDGFTSFAPSCRSFYERGKQRLGSFLGGKKNLQAVGDSLDFEVITFSPEETREMKAKSEKLAGPLFHLPFYLAGAFRAAHAILSQRASGCDALTVSTPAQTRGKTSPPLFQNHLSMFFFRLRPEEMDTFPGAVQSLSRQFAQMTKEKLDVAFSFLLAIMQWMPSRFYIAFVLWQGRGNFTSFFHSHTGEFLPETNKFFEASIENGFHIPAVSAPPGTGIFFSEFRGRTTLTISWRTHSLSRREKKRLIEHLRQDLLVFNEKNKS